MSQGELSFGQGDYQKMELKGRMDMYIYITLIRQFFNQWIKNS